MADKPSTIERGNARYFQNRTREAVSSGDTAKAARMSKTAKYTRGIVEREELVESGGTRRLAESSSNGYGAKVTRRPTPRYANKIKVVH